MFGAALHITSAVLLLVIVTVCTPTIFADPRTTNEEDFGMTAYDDPAASAPLLPQNVVPHVMAADKAAKQLLGPFSVLRASGRLNKRETQYLNDLSRRLRDMFIEYKKRQNAFQFGLGKRAQFSFGLGKRGSISSSIDRDVVTLDAPAAAADRNNEEAETRNDADDDDRIIEDAEMNGGTGEESKRTQPFAFGLGKRAGSRSGSKMFAFGLGKRTFRLLGKRPLSQKQFSFGLGKRAPREPFAFGLGKRQRQNAFQFGLGKRASYNDQRFAFGLGKRSYLSTEDDIDDSVPVDDTLVIPAAQDSTAAIDTDTFAAHHHHHPANQLVGAGFNGFGHPNSGKISAFRFGLGKRSVDSEEAAAAADDEDDGFAARVAEIVTNAPLVAETESAVHLE
ncbi:unnamed protein product [Notodromas monacha]|uniref:Uncharacterized protein n=1 Tax=Notodromas monacha TaxID=399045 RepID=A0A7R9C1F4_9CRUS|nr:unnamed protein product [Notodromas monacha]CAG0924278.1 unnamed protein product [Notodromas monacha]